MRVLISGITGLLGTALQKLAISADELYGFYHPPRELPMPLHAVTRAVDLCDGPGLRAAFEWSLPDVVIHTAAAGSVDFAERNKELARAINVDGTRRVVELCKAASIRLVYISSNAIFDGKTPPYSEDSPVNPINYYGELKCEAEQIVRENCLNWAIVRPILMYGWPYPGERENPALTWIRLLRKGSSIRIVDNVYSKPLYAESCAEAVWAVVRQRRNGVFHVAGKQRVSLSEFAFAVARVFGLNQELVIPVPDSYFPALAPRPQDTCFVTSKMESELGIQPLGLLEGLARMRDSMPSYIKLD